MKLLKKNVMTILLSFNPQSFVKTPKVFYMTLNISVIKKNDCTSL